MSAFITLEGPEGSGKTTISKLLTARLEELGYQVVLTREPGGINISEQIRNIILNKENVNMDYRTEALLLAAARRQHLVEKVKPALDENKIVICDRFIDSSLAYQGYARGIGIDEVYELNKFAIEGFMPTKTLFFDIDYTIGLKRIHENNREVNRLDLEGNRFHKRVYDGYQEVIKKYPERFEIVDASRTVAEVLESSLEIILKLI